MKISTQVLTAFVVATTIPSATQAKFFENFQSFFKPGIRGGGKNNGGNGSGETMNQQEGGWGEQEQSGFGNQQQAGRGELQQAGWGEGAHGLNLMCHFSELDTYKTALDCASDAYGQGELACYRAGLNGVNGVWACRTLYHPFTGIQQNNTVCIDAIEEAWEGDVCGCCGECPLACQCSCTDDDGNVGVLVQFGMKQQCVPVEYSAGMVASHCNASCVINCT